QLVDLPPFVPEATPAWLRAVVRQADVALLLLDLAGDPLADWATLRGELVQARVLAHPPEAPATPDEDDPRVPITALIAANKRDAPDAADALELLELEVAGALPVPPVSS